LICSAVTFNVTQHQDHTFTGTVGKLRMSPAVTQNVVTFIAEVMTDNEQGALLPYWTANVKFETERHDDVLSVPNAALRYTPAPELMVPDARAKYVSTTAAPAAGGAKAGKGGKR